jgi:sugar phosphate isomerase/epimerase
MTIPIALQLYTLRDALAADFEGTLRQVAAIGYTAVEPGDFITTPPAAAKALYDALGLTVTSAHSALPLGDKQRPALDAMAALGTTDLVSPWLDPAYYAGLDGIQQAADLFNQAHEVARAHGLTLHIHNHDFEFRPLLGRLAIDHLVELIDPAICFELDTYWIKVAGLDPAAVVAQFGPRAPLLHLKDGPGTLEGDMVALGAGVMDIPAVLAAAAPHTRWAIVELDRCATDMMAAVRQSYDYLQGRSQAFPEKPDF